MFQYWTGRTVSPFETSIALARWAVLLAVFIVGWVLFQDQGVHRWFRSAMLWYGFIVALLGTLQTFSSGGRVFWLFRTEYTEQVLGPILYRNHFAAFIEIVLPLAIYESFRHQRHALAVTALLWLQGRASGRAVGRSLVIADRPWFGFGLGHMARAISRLRPRSRPPVVIRSAFARS